MKKVLILGVLALLVVGCSIKPAPIVVSQASFAPEGIAALGEKIAHELMRFLGIAILALPAFALGALLIFGHTVVHLRDVLTRKADRELDRLIRRLTKRKIKLLPRIKINKTGQAPPA